MNNQIFWLAGRALNAGIRAAHLPGGQKPGLVTMGAGAASAAIGILYALAEGDIKRFLAYSTIENTGIIVTAFGAAMVFRAYHQLALSAFLLIAGLYHVANHGCYKTLLFLEAGVVTLDALYRPSVSVRRASDDDPAGRSGPVHYEAQVTPVFERYLYRPVVRAVEWLADVIRPLQSGDVNLYLLYVFVVILLAYLPGAV